MLLAGTLTLLPGLLQACVPGQAIANRSSAKTKTVEVEEEVSLPEAPRPQDTDSVHGTGRITGTVEDNNGAVVPGARVALTGRTDSVEQVVTSDAGGEFAFADLPGGTYRLTVTAADMGPFVSPEIRLGAGDSLTVSNVVLPILTAHVDVRVEVTETQIATEQVSEQEEQRVFGIVPNFYTSYVWNAAPLTPKLKFQLAIKSATDPVAFIGAGALAGVQQAANTFPGYGQESGGYAKRVGAAYADDVIARIIGSAILPTFLRQDPRYFYQGSGGIRSRAIHALASAVICKGDNGRRQPNFSRILGSFASGAIANLYHPPGDRGASLTVRNSLIDTAGNAGTNLFREFLLRGFTPKLPPYANGKP